MGLELRPVTACIGAEVSGIDLREPQPDAVIAKLEQALLDHLVLFFHDQDITPQQQIDFSGRFGELSVHPFGPIHPEHPEIILLDQVRPVGEGADMWHMDTSYLPTPPLGSMLRAVKLPPVGGDTCFASAYAAYESLSTPMQAMLEDLHAVHDIGVPVGRALHYGDSKLSLEEARRSWPPRSHPVVRTHPVTGRKALYVTRNATTRIEGVTERESEWLLPFLCDRMRAPEFQCRFRWRENSIAFWDNRSTQHCGIPDYHEHRVMHRTTLIGDAPR